MSRSDRKPFISVYEGAAAAMLGQFLRSWNREQREWRENNIFRTQGFRPIYRINVSEKLQ